MTVPAEPTMSTGALKSAIEYTLRSALIGDEAGVHVYRLGDRLGWESGPVLSLAVRPEFAEVVSAALTNAGRFVVEPIGTRLAVAERTKEFAA
ncbi:hypothetical protein ACFW5K_20000 [Streptomyces albidoflavus]